MARLLHILEWESTAINTGSTAPTVVRTRKSESEVEETYVYEIWIRAKQLGIEFRARWGCRLKI